MNKFSSLMLMGLCTLLLTTTVLSAEISAEKQHIPVGLRVEPQAEKEAHAKARAEMVAKGAKDTPNAPAKANGKKPQAMSASMKSLSSAVYYTLHPGAYHNPYSISIFGDSIELEDGSIWVVKPDHAHIITGWLPSDLVVITPNHTWFSSYDYKLTNQNTGEAVHVNVYLGPLYNGPFTHWIIAIDDYNNAVYLEDGSVWYMSSFDSSIIYNWVVNDTVIIGVNDGLFSSSRPNILINVNTLNYAAGATNF